MAIRITSDSTCDLGALVEERNIGILHFQVNLDANVYRDGEDITPQDIFDFVARTKILPKTSAPSVADYEEFFEEQLKGYDELIHFSISSKSSGSHNFAVEASNSFNGKVRVIDSKALSSGQGLLVLKAADMRDEGKSAEEIEKAICDLRERTNTSFVPDTLDYLHKGGRCSSMKMLAANILKIHPKIVMVDGKLQQGGTCKGSMERCISKYIEELVATYPSYDKSRCFITHSSADKELVDVAKAKVAELFEFDEVIETVAGSIITSHCGKGTLGVLFIYNK
ncbi:MAG: DegV family protein [Clostridiales bacterium]|nr:DegV family protein [Clostridiales bacterium]